MAAEVLGMIFHSISRCRRIVSAFVTASFLMLDVGGPRCSLAQEVFQLPQPGVAVGLSPAFMPVLLKGIKIHPDNPFRLDFVLDQGDDASNVRTARSALNDDVNRLIQYFLAALTVPEKDLWVNLSPYEKDRIVPDALGQTEMGRDLLSQDYILKQITASIINPDDKIGKEFWAKVYAQAQAKFGTTDIPVDAFNKVWIMPDKADVFEKDNAVYVTQAKLKVMLDSDYEAMSHAVVGADTRFAPTSELSKSVLREIIIPVLENEVNEGRNFARLRQIYNALILAVWFKDKVRSSLLGVAYVDQEKISGIEIQDKHVGEKIWSRYVQAFQHGVFNFIRDDGSEPRQYFSGGFSGEGVRQIMGRTRDDGLLSGIDPDRAMIVVSDLEPVGIRSDAAQETATGVLFKPREAVVRDDTGIYAGIRSSQEIRNILLHMKNDGKRLMVKLPIRAFDGPGSGLDKNDRRDLITKKGLIAFEEIPSTLTFSHQDLFIEVALEAADDPQATVYVAEDYGFPEEQPYVVYGPLPFTDRKVFIPKGLASSGAYIFQNLFQISGIKISVRVSHPAILAGGVESSSVMLAAELMLASILKGAGWSFADIYNRATYLENNVFDGATGGQGHFPYVLGGVYQNVWLSSLTSPEGARLFGDEVFSRDIIREEDYLYFESRMAFIQLGKEFINGGYAHPRTAEVTSVMGRDLLADMDPVGLKLYRERIQLAHQFAAALKARDMQGVIDSMNRYMDIRDELNFRWFELALMPEGSPERPSYADRYAAFLKQDPVLSDFYNTYKDGLKKISLYSFYSEDVVAKAKQNNIGLFMVGGGGSNTNAVAVANTPEELQRFLKENGIGLFNIAEAQKITRGSGLLKGYIPFRIGGALSFGEAFEAYGFDLPEFPVAATLKNAAGDVAVVADNAQQVIDFEKMERSLPAEEEIEEEMDAAVRQDIRAVVANIKKNLSSIKKKIDNGTFDLNMPVRLGPLEDLPAAEASSRQVRIGVAPGTFDSVHWGHINFWLEFINTYNSLLVVSPNGDINGYKDDKLNVELRHHLVQSAIAPFFPLIKYSPVGMDRGDLLPMAQALEHMRLNDGVKGLQMFFLSGSDALERHAKVAGDALLDLFPDGNKKDSDVNFVVAKRTDFSLERVAPGLRLTDTTPHGLQGFITGGSRLFPVTVIGLSENSISSSNIRDIDRHKIYLPRVVRDEIASGSLYVDHRNASAAWMKSSRDLRGKIIDVLRKEFNGRYLFEPGGFGAIDIASENYNKGDVVGMVMAGNPALKTVLYFGNEFFAFGNDMSVVHKKKSLEDGGRKVLVFSVDDDPEERSKLAREATIWVGTGEEASARVMRRIADAIADDLTDVTIQGEGMDSGKSVTIPLKELIGQGIALFDVDGTIINKREDDLLPDSLVGKEFVRFLAQFPVGIISANSRVMQTTRIAAPLNGVGDLKRLLMYVNGGRTLVRFDVNGNETMEMLSPEIPQEDIQKIRGIIGGLAGSNFGMNMREMEALRKWFRFNGSYGVIVGQDDRRFKNLRFNMWWMVPDFLPDVVKDVDFQKMQESGDVHYLTEPFLENRDGVQVTVKVLPKRLLLQQGTDHAENTGGIDLAQARRHMKAGLDRVEDRVVADSGMVQKMSRLLGLKSMIVDIIPLRTSLAEFMNISY
ncbi:MAG: hypothetical protein V2A70_01120 [Candidatus Omnitrophota bacterium]